MSKAGKSRGRFSCFPALFVVSCPSVLERKRLLTCVPDDCKSAEAELAAGKDAGREIFVADEKKQNR